MPSNPEYYGNACTKTSSANACGQTTTTNGTLTCDNTCNATEPTVPSNPEYYGQSCSVNSDPNACGATSSAQGTLTCDNTCNAVKPEAPANPENYGNACTKTSSANACGATNTTQGTIACDSSCNATEPNVPVNPERYGDACTSEANACGATAEGTMTCEQTCTAVTPTPEDINENEIFDCLEADITVTKAVDMESTYIGNVLVYSISWQNLSAFIANNVTISDQLPAGTTFVSSTLTPATNVNGLLTWNLGSLAGLTSGVIAITVDTDGMNAGDISNTATISSNNDYNQENNTSNSVTTTLQTPPPDPFVDLNISKSTKQIEQTVGNTITYYIDYKNDGNTTAHNIIVTDTLPAGTTLVASNPTPTTNNSGVITWEIGSLAAGAEGTIVITVDTDGMNEGTITNTASIDTACQPTDIVVGFEEEVPSSEPVVETPPVEEQTPPQEEVPVPTTDNETPEVTEENTNEEQGDTNEGEENTEDNNEENTSDEIPEVNEEEIPLPPMLLNVGPQDSEEIPEVVLCDNNTENNTDTVTTTLYPAPVIDLSVTKTANVQSVVVGGQITYTITYVNNGNTTAQGVTITDMLPEGTTFVSSTPATETGASMLTWNIGSVVGGASGTITLVVTTTTTGTVTNIASIDSRCYEEGSDKIIIPLESSLIRSPIIIEGPTVCDNNSENNGSSATVTVNSVPQGGGGGGGFGGGIIPPVTELLDTGVPSLLDTGAPQDDKKLTRGEAAKMLSEYYRNILKQEITQKDSCNPKQYKDYNRMSRNMRKYIWDACSLGLMGWRNDRKTLLENFRHNDYVTKGEFAAIISRMLYNTDGTDLSTFWYRGHVFLLKHYKIIKGTIKANVPETRGNAEALLKLKK